MILVTCSSDEYQALGYGAKPRLRLRKDAISAEEAGRMKLDRRDAMEEVVRLQQIVEEAVQNEGEGEEKQTRMFELRNRIESAKKRIENTRVLGADESGGIVASDLHDDIKLRSSDGRSILSLCSEEQISCAVEQVLQRPTFGVSEDSERSVFVRIHVSGSPSPLVRYLAHQC